MSLFNYAFLAWAVIQVNELGDILGGLNEKSLAVSGKNKLIVLPLNILTGVIIAVVGAGCLALSWLTWVIRKEFGYVAYIFRVRSKDSLMGRLRMPSRQSEAKGCRCKGGRSVSCGP